MSSRLFAERFGRIPMTVRLRTSWRVLASFLSSEEIQLLRRRILHGSCPSRFGRLCRARKSASTRLCTLTCSRVQISIL
jgi:hypothetical protein